MKNGKEITLDLFNNYSIISGTVNNKDPKSIYIGISAWAEPLDEDKTRYHRVIKDLSKKIKHHIHTQINNTIFDAHRTIVDLDLRASGINYAKKSFMNCEITLFQNPNSKRNLSSMTPTIEAVTTNTINNVFNANPYFKFHKQKR